MPEPDGSSSLAGFWAKPRNDSRNCAVGNRMRLRGGRRIVKTCTAAGASTSAQDRQMRARRSERLASTVPKWTCHRGPGSDSRSRCCRARARAPRLSATVPASSWRGAGCSADTSTAWRSACFSSSGLAPARLARNRSNAASPGPALNPMLPGSAAWQATRNRASRCCTRLESTLQRVVSRLSTHAQPHTIPPRRRPLLLLGLFFSFRTWAP